MNNVSVQNLLLNSLEDFSSSVLVIIGSVLIMGIGYLVFKFGYEKIIKDQSLMIGGFYLRKVPYKGYNRWRTRNWNLKNTL